MNGTPNSASGEWIDDPQPIVEHLPVLQVFGQQGIAPGEQCGRDRLNPLDEHFNAGHCVPHGQA